MIGVVFFILQLLLPYNTQKLILNNLARDGDLESFTVDLYTKIRLTSTILGILTGSLIAYLVIFRNKSLGQITYLGTRISDFFSTAKRDLIDVLKALIPQRNECIPLIILFVITLLGAFFRYAYLWKPMGHDETYTFIAFASRGLRVVISDYHLPNNHVLHTILVNLVTQLMGDSPAVIRLPSFMAGLLIIPASYGVGKIFYNTRIGLIAASIIASLPVMIDYSTVARGYTLLTLFSLLLIILASYVKKKRNLIAWGILVVTASLGLYVNPTMIYPIGMTYTWLLLSKLVNDVNENYGRDYYSYLFISPLLIIMLTSFIYLPIMLNSGLQSLIGNEVIESLSWRDFLQSILPRIKNTWAEWNRGLPGILSLIAVIGLLASFFVPPRQEGRRSPLILAGALWIGTALVVQRVAPWPRIWLFLLPFFVIWISAGILGLIEILFRYIPRGDLLSHLMVGLLIVLPLSAGLVINYPQFAQKLHAKGEIEVLADFLGEYLQPEDVVVVTSPDTIVLKYYLSRIGLEKEYTELEKGKSFNRAIIVVNQALGQTMEYVLERRNFMDDVDLSAVEEIYNSRRFIIYQLLGIGE